MNLIPELLEGTLSQAVEMGPGFAGVVIRWVFVAWASVAAILVARWLLGLEFKMAAIRLGTYLTGALTIFWVGIAGLLSLNSHALTMRNGHPLQDFEVDVAALWLNMGYGAATICALVVHFRFSISLAERRARAEDRDVSVGGAL